MQNTSDGSHRFCTSSSAVPSGTGRQPRVPEPAVLRVEVLADVGADGAEKSLPRSRSRVIDPRIDRALVGGRGTATPTHVPVTLLGHGRAARLTVVPVAGMRELLPLPEISLWYQPIPG